MSIEETGIAIRSYLKTAFFSKNGIDIIVATFVVCRIKITDRRWWPNDRMYCESCASVGLMMFGQRMAALTGDGKYYDIVEATLKVVERQTPGIPEAIMQHRPRRNIRRGRPVFLCNPPGGLAG